MDKKRLSQIERRIAKIKTELSGIGEMRPGSLTEQFKDRRSKTGSYFQLSYTYKMRSRTEYVRPDQKADVKRWVAEYKKFRELVDEWLDLAVEYSRIKMHKKISQK
jgi:hypothetical protein